MGGEGAIPVDSVLRVHVWGGGGNNCRHCTKSVCVCWRGGEGGSNRADFVLGVCVWGEEGSRRVIQ